MTRKIAKTDNLNKNNTKKHKKQFVYNMLHINVYTSLHLHFFIYVWEHGTFFQK